MDNFDKSEYSAALANKELIIIFQHFGSLIKLEKTFSESVYVVEDRKLYELNLVMDADKFSQNFYENFHKIFKSGKKYVYLFFSPPLAYAIDLMHQSFKKSKTIDIIGIAFFHKDEDTSRYTVQDATGKQMKMSEWKQMTLEKMEDYPFIKKFTVPVGFSINQGYMSKLLNEMI